MTSITLGAMHWGGQSHRAQGARGPEAQLGEGPSGTSPLDGTGSRNKPPSCWRPSVSPGLFATEAHVARTRTAVIAHWRGPEGGNI